MTDTIRAVTGMLHVASVPRSIAFYGQLGFSVRNTHTPDGCPEPVWAMLESHDARLMVTSADAPVDPGAQAVLFYLYCDDVAAFHARVVAAGITAGAIRRPFWSPRGEFRLEDPDGYVLIVSHT